MKYLLNRLIFSVTLLTISFSSAQAGEYEVSITNLTKGQILSPVLAVTHNRHLTLFSVGQAASLELAALAQDANRDGLNSMLSASDAVHEVVNGSDGIQPGQSDTFIIHSRGNKRFISIVSMLVTSNDAFMAVNKLKLPYRHKMMMVPAYDAGAENNDESCAYIPGPPCGNGNAQSAIAGEGFIYISSGIHGIGDLMPAMHDWNNPVAKVSIKRIHKHYFRSHGSR